jgi:hypothetical protein
MTIPLPAHGNESPVWARESDRHDTAGAGPRARPCGEGGPARRPFAESKHGKGLWGFLLN